MFSVYRYRSTEIANVQSTRHHSPSKMSPRKYAYLEKKRSFYKTDILSCPELFGRLIVGLVEFVEWARKNDGLSFKEVRELCQYIHGTMPGNKRLHCVRSFVNRKIKFLLHFIEQHKIEALTTEDSLFQSFEDIGRLAYIEAQEFYRSDISQTATPMAATNSIPINSPDENDEMIEEASDEERQENDNVDRDERIEREDTENRDNSDIENEIGNVGERELEDIATKRQNDGKLEKKDKKECEEINLNENKKTVVQGQRKRKRKGELEKLLENQENFVYQSNYLRTPYSAN